MTMPNLVLFFLQRLRLQQQISHTCSSPSTPYCPGSAPVSTQTVALNRLNPMSPKACYHQHLHNVLVKNSGSLIIIITKIRITMIIVFIIKIATVAILIIETIMTNMKI